MICEECGSDRCPTCDTCNCLEFELDSLTEENEVLKERAESAQRAAYERCMEIINPNQYASKLLRNMAHRIAAAIRREMGGKDGPILTKNKKGVTTNER